MATATTPHQSLLRADPPYQYGKPDRFPNLTKPLRWRATAIQAGGARETVELESAAWDDVTAILTGSITARDLEYGNEQPRIGQGIRVMLEVDEGAGFAEVWTMRCGAPMLTASNSQRTFEMANDLDLLNRSADDFYWTKDRAHPHGWRSDQMIQKVCADYNVPIAPNGLVRGHYLTGSYANPKQPTKGTLRMHVRGSPLDMIRNIVKWERRGHGTRLVIRYDSQHLSVLPLRRSKHLLALGPTLMEAQLQSVLPAEYASAVMFHANLDLTNEVTKEDAKGRKKTKPSKMHVLVESPASVRRFGYVRRIVFSPDASSTAEMRQQAQLWLATVARPFQTVTLTLQGIPHLKRGDAIELAIGDWGLRRQVVFVNQVSHRLTPTDYTMTVQCIFADPYIDRRGLKITYLLQSTSQGAQGIAAGLSQQMGLGSPQKNDTSLGPFSSSTTDPANAPAGSGFDPSSGVFTQ